MPPVVTSRLLHGWCAPVSAHSDSVSPRIATPYGVFHWAKQDLHTVGEWQFLVAREVADHVFRHGTVSGTVRVQLYSCTRQKPY
eukprot:COSAG01_NODE_172_length_23108_cov_26.690496_15_plen_84_part_00